MCIRDSLTIVPKELTEKHPYLEELVENKVCARLTCREKYEVDRLKEEVA